ncbi:transmembrane protease serine 12-like [Portunus trituberculatus]|uniref:transmembrane protease serine 12-like n=1 Tax=Portunus trituberculatus TaxID=210409 RepID=UPI001E1D120D|nr:transmembrane protease serine 12-like [Portunus trituberculatus]
MKFSVLFIVYEILLLAAAEAKRLSVAGSQDANKGQFPWLVTLELNNTQRSWHKCDGVLLTKQWVLTAAHCVDNEKPEYLQVVSGEHRRDLNEGTEQKHKVNNILKYPQFIHTHWVGYMTPYIHDVALVHLSQEVKLDKYTQRIILDPGTFPIVGTRCLEAGWGTTKDGGNMSDVLRFTEVPVRPLEECERVYNMYIHENSICAGSVHSGIGFCTGDNGGGLFCYDPNKQEYVLSAVLSWREGCAGLNKPAVYMDVLPYLPWFVNIIGDDIFWPEKEGI